MESTRVAPVIAAAARSIASGLSALRAEESSHMGSPDFRVGGRIFATLAAQAQGYGNLVLTPDHQAAFVEEQPELFVPIAAGWGRMGMTHIRLAEASEDVLAGALRSAWKLRIKNNEKADKKKRTPAKKIVLRRSEGSRNLLALPPHISTQLISGLHSPCPLW